MTIKRNSENAITNALELTVDQVVHECVICPLGEDKVFKMWPKGWDAHAAYKCNGDIDGVSGSNEERKTEFKRQCKHLFLPERKIK